MLLVAGEVGPDALIVHGVSEFYVMPPPTTMAVDLPPPWFDLALNEPGCAVRERARVEYEVLCQRHTKVGARFLKWTDRKTDERAWRVGAKGEVRVGGLLEKLTRHGFRVLHSVPVGQGDSDIDHVVVGPPGVFTVNTKKHLDAKVWVGGNGVKINGHNHPYVRNSRFEARRAGRLLGIALGWTPVVTALLVFDTTGAGSLTIKAQPEDVAVMGHRDLQTWLRRQPTLLDARQVDEVFEVARRSTTWTARA